MPDGCAGIPACGSTPPATNPRKIAAIGVRLAHGRTMHGFALNVTTDMAYMREHIVACGIGDRPVTSLAEEGIDVSMARVVDVVARLAGERWGGGASSARTWRGTTAPTIWSRSRAAPVRATRSPIARGRTPGSSRPASPTGLSIETRKPDWLRPKVHLGPEVMELKRSVRELGLVTVCEDAGCPNLSECWSDGTATLMVLGDRCTRACGFCLVDTRKPLPPADDEPERVAEAVRRMGLDHAVLTMVARDDLPDGGMAHVARCVEAIRDVRPGRRRSRR